MALTNTVTESFVKIWKIYVIYFVFGVLKFNLQVELFGSEKLKVISVSENT